MLSVKDEPLITHVFMDYPTDLRTACGYKSISIEHVMTFEDASSDLLNWTSGLVVCIECARNAPMIAAFKEDLTKRYTEYRSHEEHVEGLRKIYKDDDPKVTPQVFRQAIENLLSDYNDDSLLVPKVVTAYDCETKRMTSEITMELEPIVIHQVGSDDPRK